jgi:hypothetical protein
MGSLPRFFRVRQHFPAPRVDDIAARVHEQLLGSGSLTGGGILGRIQPGQSVAITAGSRGIANIPKIIRACVDAVKSVGGLPYVVPAMGSHGGASAEGQKALLGRLGMTEESLGCEIRSSMETVIVTQATEGFPVHFDRHAFQADHVLVVNRIKPHTRFAGSIESGLMKMMLIGLGKTNGAEVYHRAIMKYSFDQIIRAVVREVVAKCRIIGGLAILENGDEETADIVACRPEQIEIEEAQLLNRVRSWLPKLPFEECEVLIVDRIGKDISGAGMDTNVVGRKFNDHAHTGDETPRIHNIYVRGLTKATHGNATGIGISELCHQRLIDGMDLESTKINCLTAGHVTAAMVPIAFTTDRAAIEAAVGMAGLTPPADVTVQWIPDTLHLNEIECSEVFFRAAQNRTDLKILQEPTPLDFDPAGNLVERFSLETDGHH